LNNSKYDNLVLKKSKSGQADAEQNKAREVIRKHVEHLQVDRPLYNDHNAMKKLVKSGKILEEVEKLVGKLG